jgi:EpsI family protein
MLTRSLLLSACFALTSGYLTWANGAEHSPARGSLTALPGEIGAWSGRPAPKFSEDVLATLGVDDYVNRFYMAQDRVAHLYIGYYASQRQGSSIHSPLNCLPGAGWLPVSHRHLDISVASSNAPVAARRTIRVNRYIIEKGLDRQLVLYWYQSHGRVVSSEYWSKWYLVLDSIRLHRTDAALVRIIVPYPESDPAAEAAAERTAADFVKGLFPLLDPYLPV